MSSRHRTDNHRGLSLHHDHCRGRPEPALSVAKRSRRKRSEFRSPHKRDRGTGTRRATPGRQWFWVLLPKQKNLVVWGRNPTKACPSSRGAETPQPFFPLCIHTYASVRTPRRPCRRTPQITEWSFPKMNRSDNVQSTRASPHPSINKPANKKNNKKRNTKGLTYAFVKRRIPNNLTVL